MDVADDADGRVAIFSVEDLAEQVPPPPPPPGRGGAASVGAQIGRWLDDAYAGVGVAVVLVVILVLGLLLSRH